MFDCVGGCGAGRFLLLFLGLSSLFDRKAGVLGGCGARRFFDGFVPGEQEERRARSFKDADAWGKLGIAGLASLHTMDTRQLMAQHFTWNSQSCKNLQRGHSAVIRHYSLLKKCNKKHVPQKRGYRPRAQFKYSICCPAIQKTEKREGWQVSSTHSQVFNTKPFQGRNLRHGSGRPGSLDNKTTTDHVFRSMRSLKGQHMSLIDCLMSLWFK